MIVYLVTRTSKSRLAVSAIYTVITDSFAPSMIYQTTLISGHVSPTASGSSACPTDQHLDSHSSSQISPTSAHEAKINA